MEELLCVRVHNCIHYESVHMCVTISLPLPTLEVRKLNVDEFKLDSACHKLSSEIPLIVISVNSSTNSRSLIDSLDSRVTGDVLKAK